MIKYVDIGLAAVFIEAVNILLAEKKTSLYLTLFSILTIILFFLV
jgi:hypothetical protein